MNFGVQQSVFSVVMILAVSLSLVAAAGAVECPSDNVNDIVKDPVVQDALKDAWEDSEEGTPDEHEEGGFVLECVSISPDGTVVYEIQVIRVPRGDGKSLGSKIPDLPDGCRVIAWFHTHPGPEKGHPEDDGFYNKEPSGRDLDWSERTGLPGIIVYGTGPEYDDDTETITFGRESPLDKCQQPEKKAGESSGDPHLRTFDGFGYDFQAVGEYVMASNEGIEVQARFEPLGVSTVVSITSAVAVRLGPSVVNIHLDGELRLDGEVVSELPLEVNGVIIDSGGEGAVGETVRLIWPDGTTLIVSNRRVLLNVRLETLRFGWEGLFGDGDEDPTNDLLGIDGPLDGRTDFAALYEELAPRWATTAATSMFTYRAGESHESFFDDAFPSSVVGFEEFDEAEVDAARALCVEAVIWMTPYVDDCTYDFLVSGESEVVNAAAGAHRRQFPTVDLGRFEDRVQVTGSVNVEEGGAIYLVEGDPGSLLSVTVDSIREVARCPRLTANFRLLVLDRSGEEVGSDWPGNSGCRAYGPWVFPSDGRLGVVIHSGGRSELQEDPLRTGSFTLTIGAPNGRVEPLALSVDEQVPVDGNIGIPLDFVDYRITGEPGDLVSVDVSSLDGIVDCPGEVWDLRLVALADDGTEVGSEWPGNEGCRPYGGWAIPDDGELTVRVQGGDGALAPTTGDYEMTIGRYRYDEVAVDTTGGAQQISGAVEIALDGTTYQVTAPPGSELFVDVASMDGIADCGRQVWNLRLTVSGSNGDDTVAGWPGNSGCGTFGPWTVPASGTLVLLAKGHDFGPAPATGTYEIGFRFQ